MARAAETAAHIASGRASAAAATGLRRARGTALRRDDLGVLSLAERIALVERADRAARAYDPRIDKVIVTLAEETKHVRIANSAGVLVEDVQPLFSIRVSVIAADKGVRREGSAGAGAGWARGSSRASRRSTSPARRRAWR